MLKKNRKYVDLLPKHQKKIVLSLAKNEPMTMSETNRKISGELTSTTRAFHELEKKGMVIEVGKKKYRGRKFSEYWLSDRGVAFTLLNGANAETARQIALSLTEDDKLKTYFELRELSPEIATIIDKAVLHRGIIDFAELVKLLIPEVASTGKAGFEKFFDAIKDSEFEGILDYYIKHLRVFLNELERR